MKVELSEKQNFLHYYMAHKERFHAMFKIQGGTLFETIKKTGGIDPKFILESSHKVVLLLNEGNEQVMSMHAKEEGRTWARLNLDFMLKFEWFQVLRKLYWSFLFSYHTNVGQNQSGFYRLERQVNGHLDAYLKYFALGFTEYKNRVTPSQREAIEDIPVPILPLADNLALLPIVGSLDSNRARELQEVVLFQTYQSNIKQMIIDLSGLVRADSAIVEHLLQIVHAAAEQGCKAVITGLRPEFTFKIMEISGSLHKQVEIRGTLQQAYKEYISGKL